MKSQLISEIVFAEKYAKNGETTEQVFNRVAKQIASIEKDKDYWEKQFLKNFQYGAVGAGRIMAAAGTAMKSTLINCFVQPVGDCLAGTDDDGLPGIYEALKQAALTMQMGGGVGYNFSAIRPKGALVASVDSIASGPISFIDTFDASCATLISAGGRRGAQMGVLNISHPDIWEFIRAKHQANRWTNFNVSVAVTQEFMDALKNKKPFHLVHKAKPKFIEGHFQNEKLEWVYETVDPANLWDEIIRSTYQYSEPGVLFLDNINSRNNLRYCEVIVATNPCGEQPIPYYGCCDLGPIMLANFVKQPFTSNASFDFELFKEIVGVHVRFLDNVLDVTAWPLAEQKKEAMQKRRIGVGITGLGNTLAMLGYDYRTDQGREYAEKIVCQLKETAYTSSVSLAKEKGAFPLFDADKFLEKGTFASTLSEEIQQQIRQFGIRNSHLTSIAPVGTISLAFGDNCSNGAEPPFQLVYKRKKREQDGSTKEFIVIDHGLRVFASTVDYGDDLIECLAKGGTQFHYQEKTFQVRDVLPQSLVTALEISALDHVKMVASLQKHICSAISKTVNIPEDYSYEYFKDLYTVAHESGLKGLATYRPSSVRGSVLEKIETPAVKVQAPTVTTNDIDPLKVQLIKRDDGDLNSITSKVKYLTSEGSHTLYLTISFALVNGVVNGVDFAIERPIEIFIQGNSTASQDWVAMFSRLLSLSAKNGGLAEALHQSRQTRSDRNQVRYGFIEKENGQKVPRFHNSEVAAIAYAVQQILYRKGFLDIDGNQIPSTRLSQNLVQSFEMEKHDLPTNQVVFGKECNHCGAHAVVPRDGCQVCTNCGEIGTCG